MNITVEGLAYHDECINHCLPWAFGECDKVHLTECENCSRLFTLFEEIYNFMPSEYLETLNDLQKQLEYYLSHQTRKKYLNSQFNANLRSIDGSGALIVVDYKMRILPKHSRETKQDFFGKRGWALHTVLVFTRSETMNNIEIQAFDHWSADTKQDAWFTASSFDAVFDSFSQKPKWIVIMSDNGPHYHNSELMVLVSQWKEWYNIECKKWIFLEAGEAKTAIDSHHAQV